MERVFRQYRIARHLTTSSLNQAYLARSSSDTEWSYVVKVYARRLRHAQEEEIFRQHMAALRLLEHPNILPITDYGIEKRIPFCVTRYLPNGSLHDRQKHNLSALYSMKEIFTIIEQVGQALQYAHSHHIIHGNIKPENILFNKNNEVQIVDFCLPENADETDKSKPNVAQPSYYPESEALSEKSDQYALAHLANELFGNLLSSEETPSVPAHQAIKATAEPASPHPTVEITKQINAVLLKALSRDPDERYEDVATFVKALNEACVIQSAPASPLPINNDTLSPASSRALSPVRGGILSFVNALLYNRKTTQSPAASSRLKQFTHRKAGLPRKLLIGVGALMILGLLASILTWQTSPTRPVGQIQASPIPMTQVTVTSIPLQPVPIHEPIATATPGVPPRVIQPTPGEALTPTAGPPPTPTIETALPSASGYWAFDEGEGFVANDLSGQGHTGYFQGNAQWGPPRIGSSALSLFGPGSYAGDVDIPAPIVNTTQSFSVTAWVKLNSVSGYQTFVSIDGYQVSGFYLQLRKDTGKFAFTQLASDSDLATPFFTSAPYTPVAGVWYHLAGVYDACAHTLALYINGSLQQTVAYTGAWQASGHTMIGRGKFGGKPVDFVNGEIDDVHIYNVALTASNVTAIMGE